MAERQDIEQVGELGAAKEYPSARVKVEAFMVEKVQWQRIRRRIGKIEASHAPEWLLGVATLSAGVTASAVIAYVVLPSATKSLPRQTTDSTIAEGTRPALISTAIAGAVIAVALGLLYWREHKKHAGEKTDLQDEMDTIEKAWEQSVVARSAQTDKDRQALTELVE